MQLLPLGLGLGAGRLLGGLACAQRCLHGAAVVVAGVGKAHQQARAAAPGLELEVVIEPVGLVVGFVGQRFARLERAPVVELI